MIVVASISNGDDEACFRNTLSPNEALQFSLVNESKKISIENNKNKEQNNFQKKKKKMKKFQINFSRK